MATFLHFTKYPLVHSLKTPYLRPATDFSSTKVTSNVLTHVTYVSLMRITSFKSASSFMSLTYKWFAVMWLPEIDYYRHWYILWYYPAIDAAFGRFNSTSKVDFPFLYHQKCFHVPFVILQHISEEFWASSAPIIHLNNGVHNCYCA